MPALVAMLIPLLPGLIKSLMDVVNAMNAPDMTPEEAKAKLDAISLELQDVVNKVKAVQLPNPPGV